MNNLFLREAAKKLLNFLQFMPIVDLGLCITLLDTLIKSKMMYQTWISQINFNNEIRPLFDFLCPTTRVFEKLFSSSLTTRLRECAEHGPKNALELTSRIFFYFFPFVLAALSYDWALKFSILRLRLLEATSDCIEQTWKFLEVFSQ